MRKCLYFFVLVFGLLNPQIVYTEVIVTKSNNTYKGEILNIDEFFYEVKTTDGIMKIKKTEIKSITIDNGSNTEDTELREEKRKNNTKLNSKTIKAAAKLNMKGNRQMEKAQTAKAAEIYKKAIEIYPNYHYSYSNLANIYLGQLELKKAEELATKSLEIKATPESYSCLGVIKFREDNYNKAIDLFKQALECKDETDRKGASKDFLISQLYANIATSYQRLGNYKLAIQNYNNALKVYKKNKYAEEQIKIVETLLKE